MAVKVKIVQRINPQNKEEEKKFYAQSSVNGSVSLDTLARRIAKASMATRGDVHGVLASLVDEIIESLEEGNSVKLGDLGTMRVSVSSTGSETKEDVSANNVKQTRIVYTPSTMLKARLNQISFRLEKVTDETTTEEDDSDIPDEL